MNALTPVFFDRLQATLGELSRLVAQLRDSAETDSPSSPEAQAEYLSVKQLASRIPYKEHTIRNLISAGAFRAGLHYHKRRGKVMFSWPAVQGWVEQQDSPRPESIPLVRNRYGHSQ